ncbi:MAG: hypothetical protein GF350_16415 [Chitinivibrionales bacterium]|nr:hypothetical protein [Chitinivibrionales bacterium]
MTILGGFAGNETDSTGRDREANKTVLTGDLLGDGSLLSDTLLSIGAGATVDGIHIGVSDYFGIYVNTSEEVTIEKCTFANIVDMTRPLYIQNAVVNVNNCIFSNNKLGFEFGRPLIDITDAAVYINQCLFEKNDPVRYLLNIQGSGTITAKRCVFYGNYATKLIETGGNGYLNIYSSIFIQNGGDIDLSSSNPASFDRCTFYDNNLTKIITQSGLSLSNSIIWWDRADMQNEKVMEIIANTTIIKNCNIRYGQDSIVVWTGANLQYNETTNVAISPDFKKTLSPGGNPLKGCDDILMTSDDAYSLKSTSQLRDIGGATLYEETDLTGFSGVWGTYLDIGAYEYQGEADACQ